MKHHPDQRMNFPLLLVKSDQRPDYQLKKSKKAFTMNSQSTMSVIGDMDLSQRLIPTNHEVPDLGTLTDRERMRDLLLNY